MGQISVTILAVAGSNLSGNQHTTGVRYINAIEMVGNDTGQNRPILSLNKSTHSLDCSTSPKEVLIRLELELMSGTLVGGACLIATWTAGSGGVTATVAKMLDAAMDNVTGKVQVVEFYIPRPVTYVAGAAPTFDLTLYTVSNVAGHTRAACTLRVHRFDFEEVLAGSTTSIYQQTVAKTDGISSAVIGMRAAAGSGGALLELVALSDPSGGAVSAARIAADNILLDGSVTARHIEAGSMNADIIGAGVLNARFLEVTEQLTIDNVSGAFSLGKESALDISNEGIFLGRTDEGGGLVGFGFAVGKTVGGIEQYLQATSQGGLKSVNSQHYVTGAAAPVPVDVTSSQTITLPVGTRLLNLQMLGGGGGGTGGTTYSSQTAIAASNGTATTVQLFDGATNTGISWTSAGGLGSTTVHSADYGYAGGNSSLGVGGAGGVDGNIGGNGGTGSGYGSGGGGGGGTEKGGDGGKAATLISVMDYDISALTNPKLVIVIGTGGAGSAGQDDGPYQLGGDGGTGAPGIVIYAARTATLLPASVIPLAPTYTGTLTKAASGKLTFPDYGAGMWCLSAQGTNLLLDYVTTHASGKTVKLTNGNYACFISDITPVDDAVSATAVTYEYQFFKLGNWV